MDTMISKYHLHPIIDHFTIALLSMGVLADIIGSLIAALCGNRSPRLKALSDRLRGAALVLLVPGAISAVLSRFTGESEADRLWDTMSPAAQGILLSDAGFAGILSHAVLGVYLMYAFLTLAVWRVLLEMWPKSGARVLCIWWLPCLPCAPFCTRERPAEKWSMITRWVRFTRTPPRSDRQMLPND